MGASEFRTRGQGKTVREAYRAAVDDARYEHGHGGYTGTVAEKDGFREFTLPADVPLDLFIAWVEDNDVLVPCAKDDPKWASRQGHGENEKTFKWAPAPPIPAAYAGLVKRVQATYEDKWGPAVALKVAEGEWLFLGMASS